MRKVSIMHDCVATGMVARNLQRKDRCGNACGNFFREPQYTSIAEIEAEISRPEYAEH